MPFSRAAALLVATTILAGCAVLTADGERLTLTSPEFRAYVERVFREQNRVADQFAFALEDERGAPALTAAEQSLLDACAALNELATARRDDRHLSLRQRSTAARSAPMCERTMRASVATLDAWRATRR